MLVCLCVHHEWALILSNVFSVYIEMIKWVLSFFLLIWYIIMLDFSDVKLILYFWDKSYLIMVCNPFYMLLDCFTMFYSVFEDFCLYIHKVFILLCSFSWQFIVPIYIDLFFPLITDKSEKILFIYYQAFFDLTLNFCLILMLYFFISYFSSINVILTNQQHLSLLPLFPHYQ